MAIANVSLAPRAPRSPAVRLVVVAWAIATAIIAYRQIKVQSQSAVKLPPPCAFIGAAIVYSILGVMAEVLPDLAMVFAVGATFGLGYRALSSPVPPPGGKQQPPPTAPGAGGIQIGQSGQSGGSQQIPPGK